MRIKISRILLAIMVIYSITWFIISGVIKSKIEEESKKLPDGIELSFSDVSVSGFPFHFQIELDNLNFKLKNSSPVRDMLIKMSLHEKDENKSEMLKKLANDKSSLGVGFQSHGKLTTKINGFLRLKDITLYGDFDIWLKLMKDQFKIASKGQKKKIKINSNSFILAQEHDPLEIVQSIRTSCGKCELIDLVSKKKLVTAKKNSYLIKASKIDRKSGLLMLDFKIDDFTILNESVNLIKRMKKNAVLSKFIGDVDLSMFSDVSNQVKDLDASGKVKYEGTIDPEEIKKGNVKFSMSFPSKFSNKNFSHNSLLDVELSMKENDVKLLNFFIDGKYDYGLKFYEFIANHFSKFNEEFIADKTSKYVASNPYLSFYINNSHIFLPKIHEFKKIELISDISYLKKNQIEQLDVKNFKIDFEKYGSSIRGGLTNFLKHDQSKYDFDLKIDQYSPMLDDSFIYAKRIAEYAKRKNFRDSTIISGLTSSFSRNFIEEMLKDVSKEKAVKNGDLEFKVVKSKSDQSPLIGVKKISFKDIQNKFFKMRIKHEISKNKDKIKNKLKEKLNDKVGSIGGRILDSIF